MSDVVVQANGGKSAGEKPSAIWFTPRFDVWETEDAFVLAGDLPGVAPEGLEITFEKGELSIWGRAPARYPQARFFAGEYGVGDFRRTFTIGEAVNAEAISAELKDGVLSVRLPKRAEARARKIDVRVA